MNMEIIKQSLDMAIDESFRLTKLEQYHIEESISKCSQFCLDQILHCTAPNKSPGMKLVLANAFCSGNRSEIEETVNIAHNQAILAILRKSAKQAVTIQSKPRKVVYEAVTNFY